MDSSPRISNLVTELTDPQFLSGLELWRSSWVCAGPADHGHGEGEGDPLDGDHGGPLWTILCSRHLCCPRQAAPQSGDQAQSRVLATVTLAGQSSNGDHLPTRLMPYLGVNIRTASHRFIKHLIEWIKFMSS